ncbi:PHP domain-containing protein [Rhodococcus sp. X156]|uniref:PHP domain-containing protein n=1 Tax=Rhodococcus sp. X156 TaxID=2499145 RepID=UPI000FD9289B|nr:PHP domain-containing protein [Rhodococcus sp. X156]
MNAVTALRRIAFLLERAREASHRVQAFRNAADVVTRLSPTDLDRRVAAGTLTDLGGIGPKTAAVITQAHTGHTPDYLVRLEESAGHLVEGGEKLLAQLRGDLHCHSSWSDGGSPVEEMAATAVELGHEYLAMTDHSPRLTVARGLTAERLREQLALVATVNEQLAPFRLLSGIECDINVDGTLDQTDELLGEVDVVVASVHSKLRTDRAAMTARMLAAVRNPHTDVLGHVTGRLVTGDRGVRPESDFDAEAVFAACAEHDVAVEINSRPERLDPPRRLLRQAVAAGCLFSVDTDAHAPGQLDWQAYGCARAEECDVDPDRVVNTWPLADLLAWTRRSRL